MVAVATGVVQAQSHFERPPPLDGRGRYLLTSLIVVGTSVDETTRTDVQRQVFAPWYIGDSARDAAQSFCEAMADHRIDLGVTFARCVYSLERSLVDKATEYLQMVMEVSEATPTLQPLQLAKLGALEAMQGLLPNLGQTKWRPGVYRELLAQQQQTQAKIAARESMQAQTCSSKVRGLEALVSGVGAGLFLCLTVCSFPAETTGWKRLDVGVRCL